MRDRLRIFIVLSNKHRNDYFGGNSVVVAMNEAPLRNGDQSLYCLWEIYYLVNFDGVELDHHS